MAKALTAEDVWKMFRKTNRLFQESKIEWERRHQEAERQQKDQLKDARLEWERQQKEIQEKWEQERKEAQKKWEQEHRETERVVKEVSRQIGQLGSRWGEFVESMVAPACETLFAQRGIPVHQVFQHVKARLPGNRHMEIDILVVNTGVMVLIEVKSRLRAEDVRDFLNRLAEVKEFFPVYADKRVMGAVAGIVIEDGVERFAMNEGLFVIMPAGETVRLVNDEQFEPRTW